MASIKNKRVLVTGGAGFIGSHLCDALAAAGAEKIVCVDNFFLGKTENLKNVIAQDHFVLYKDDARSLGVMQAVMEKEQIEVVFNLATIALNYSFFNPFDAYMVNVEIADTLLKLLKLGVYRTLVHVSSSEAYGTAQYSPMDENHPMNPTTPYAAGKAAADLMVHSFYKVFGMDVCIVRPFNNYGPRQNADGSLAAIIPATARRIKEGGRPVIEGDGEQTRDFIYVSDTVSGLLLAYENEASRGKITNLGSGKDISIRNLLHEICDYMGYTGEWEHRKERVSDVKKLCASTTAAEQYLGFKAKVGFQEGIAKTLDWYLSKG